jgi:hypothetical protein
MITESQQLAQLWVELQSLRLKLDATVIPLAEHLGMGIQDPNLLIALNELSRKIENHFICFKLQASRIRSEQGGEK